MKYILLILIFTGCCNHNTKPKGASIHFTSDNIVIDAHVLIDSLGIHDNPNFYFRCDTNSITTGTVVGKQKINKLSSFYTEFSCGGLYIYPTSPIIIKPYK